MLANVSVGYTLQTTDIFFCCRHGQTCRPEMPAKFFYVGQFFGCRRRVGETCISTDEVVTAYKDKKMASSQICHPLASTYSK